MKRKRVISPVVAAAAEAMRAHAEKAGAFLHASATDVDIVDLAEVAVAAARAKLADSLYTYKYDWCEWDSIVSVVRGDFE